MKTKVDSVHIANLELKQTLINVYTLCISRVIVIHVTFIPWYWKHKKSNSITAYMYDLPVLTKSISNAVIENVDEWEGNKMVVKKFFKKHAVDKGDYLSMMIVILME